MKKDRIVRLYTYSLEIVKTETVLKLIVELACVVSDQPHYSDLLMVALLCFRYNLAETIDGQLKRMSEDLREVIDHVNATSAGGDAGNPVSA